MNNVLLSVAQMTRADHLATTMGTPGFKLMQNAGMAVAREAARRWTPRPTIVLCGPGNNGGDGFVAAVALAEAGWPVRVALNGVLEQLQGDALAHAQRWQGPIEAINAGALDGAELAVDALYGSGLNRPLAAPVPELLSIIASRGIPVIAIDVPSGVLGDSGESQGAIAATCTVTFARKKPGHLLLPGRELCGDLVVADIGIPDAAFDTLGINTWENEPALWRTELPQLQRTANKYSRGHVLISGGYPITGAARMAARAAARIGAGLTSIAVPEAALPIYAAALQSIMVQPLSSPQEFERLLQDPRYSGFLIGPGAGVNEATRERALRMLATGRPVLLDADAISVFAADPSQLFNAIRGPCVLTPHEGEYQRLFSDTDDKLSRARQAAVRSQCIIVLKGADTVIASPDGRAVINSNAPATLATGGSGDVLGGLILGLLGQGMDAFMAACAAVWLHGAAATTFGPGLLAEDLPDLIPGVLRSL
jgi:ADP-dependent NAD(P)H-hydrate dehydratase / NAD(P)H-hydrate epimerase